MATATLELINPYSKYGLKRRPTYDEIIGLIKENETITGNLPDRIATFYKASPEGSFFDGSDALEILKEQQNRIMEREMRDILMRRNARLNGRTYNAERILASQSNTAPAEVQPDRETLSAEVQADLQRREAQLRSRQQQTGEAHRQQVSEQSRMPTLQGFIGESLSFIFRLIPSPTGQRHVPQLPIPQRQAEQIDLTRGDDMRAEEEEFFPEELMTARESTEELIINSLRFRHPNATAGEINRVARTLVKYSNLKPEQIATSFSNLYMLNDMYDVLYRNGFISDEVMEDFQTLTNQISQEGGGRKRASLLRRLANHYRDHVYDNYISHISNRPVPA